MDEVRQDVVWSARLDARFDCAVVRLAPAEGELTVRDGGAVIGSKRVFFSYGAVFGPDVDDVADWQDWCVKLVERLSHPTLPEQLPEAGITIGEEG